MPSQPDMNRCYDEELLDQPLSISVAQLSMNERLSLLSGDSMWSTPGIPRLGIQPLAINDGPHGVRKPVNETSILESFPATCFPTAAALACSWDEALLSEVGRALQKECSHHSVNVLLGPGMNLKRHPCGGRNFEYFSEDPVLSGRLASAYVEGVQESGEVGACVKHFAVNNQESHRFVVDAICDDRTMREMYLKGFEIVLKQQSVPAAVMCAYNQLNGTFCSEHRELLTDILRIEWGYTGVTMTDWGATNNRIKGIKAGMDLEMPGSHGAHYWSIMEELKKDDYLRKSVDESAQRMLDLAQKISTNTCESPIYDSSNDIWQTNSKVAYRAALSCCILLKNDSSFLPFSPEDARTVAVVGSFAKDSPRFQGMGSSQVLSQNVTTVYDSFKRYIHGINCLTFAPGYHIDDEHTENVDSELVREAVLVAQVADVVVLCIGLPEIMESEGFDRTHLQLPAQHNALVDALCEVNSNVVVVLSNGGAVEMPWSDRPKAILEGYLLGEGGGAAIVDIMVGVESPCGKLAETFPECLQDALADTFFPGSREVVEYREGLLVGYRYFDTVSKSVLFPFGHGLSYTTFAYSELSVDVTVDQETDKAVEVRFLITNSGVVAASEVVQCYVHCIASDVFRPYQELKDFTKLHLNSGETKVVHFSLQKDAFSIYDIGTQEWIVETTDFEIRIGSSSRDIRLQAAVRFHACPTAASEVARASYPPCKENPLMLKSVDDVTFANRFKGRPHSEQVATEVTETIVSNGFHRNSLLKEIAETRWLGKFFLWIVFFAASREIESGPSEKRQKRMVRATVQNLPLRALVLFSKGGISFDTLDACIDLMNYNFLAAIRGFGSSLFHCVRPRNWIRSRSPS